MSRPENRRGDRHGRGADRLERFSRAERSVHHLTALLMLVCLVTAALLYVPALSAEVGRRDLIKPLHVYAGFALPVPVLLGLIFRAFRADLGRFNRFSPQDWEWLRRRDRRAVTRRKTPEVSERPEVSEVSEVSEGDGGAAESVRGVIAVGKFNAGQKLNAAFTAGAILIMLGTGVLLTFPDPWPDRWRTGATFVHDWLFLIIVVVTLGHLWYALSDRGALGGMLTGRVDRAWAARHHAGWLDDLDRAGRRTGEGPAEDPGKNPGNDAGDQTRHRTAETPGNTGKPAKTSPDRS